MVAVPWGSGPASHVAVGFVEIGGPIHATPRDEAGEHTDIECECFAVASHLRREHINEILAASRKSWSTSDKSCVLQGCVDDAQGALCDSGHEASIRREDDCRRGLSDWVSRCEAMSVSTWLGAVTGIDVSSCRYQQKLLFGRRSLVRKIPKDVGSHDADCSFSHCQSSEYGSRLETRDSVFKEAASMKSNFSASFKCLLAFALALGSTTWPGVMALDRLAVAVDRTSRYSAGTDEANEVARWLDARKDVHQRTLALGTLTIRHRCRGERDSPRTPAIRALFHHGASGENITITNDSPGCAHETWTFAWTGDGQDAYWKQTAYGWRVLTT